MLDLLCNPKEKEMTLKWSRSADKQELEESSPAGRCFPKTRKK
jgi:hypothetical protein